jgi:hypothetical protein
MRCNVGSDGAVTAPGAGPELTRVSRPTAEAIADGAISSILTVGRAGTGAFDVVDGGLVTIDAGGALFAGPQGGRSAEDGGTGTGTITVAGAGSAIEIPGSNDTAHASAGFMEIGRFARNEGSLSTEDGGRVRLPGVGVAEVADSGGRVGERGRLPSRGREHPDRPERSALARVHPGDGCGGGTARPISRRPRAPRGTTAAVTPARMDLLLPSPFRSARPGSRHRPPAPRPAGPRDHDRDGIHHPETDRPGLASGNDRAAPLCSTPIAA